MLNSLQITTSKTIYKKIMNLSSPGCVFDKWTVSVYYDVILCWGFPNSEKCLFLSSSFYHLYHKYFCSGFWKCWYLKKIFYFAFDFFGARWIYKNFVKLFFFFNYVSHLLPSKSRDKPLTVCYTDFALRNSS